MGQQPTENNTARGLWGLYRFIEKSSMNNKDELIAYLKERYTAF